MASAGLSRRVEKVVVRFAGQPLECGQRQRQPLQTRSIEFGVGPHERGYPGVPRWFWLGR